MTNLTSQTDLGKCSQTHMQSDAFLMPQIHFSPLSSLVICNACMLNLLNNHANLPKPLPLLQRHLCIKDLLQPSLHIHLHRIPSPLIAPKHNAVADVHDKKDWNADVGCQKGAGGPFLGEEDRETIDQAQDREGDHGDPRAIGLDPAGVDGRDVLGLAGFAKAEVHDHAGHPAGHTPGVCELEAGVSAIDNF